MAFRINESAMGRLLNSTTGPVGQEIGRKADRVAEIAYANASGEVIGVRSSRLRDGIRAHVEGSPEGVRGIVGTNAVSISKKTGIAFAYPAFHDKSYPPGSGGGESLPGGGEHPWLTEALIEVFS